MVAAGLPGVTKSERPNEQEKARLARAERRIDQLPAPAPEKPRFWWQVAIAIAVRDVMTVVIVAVGMLRR